MAAALKVEIDELVEGGRVPEKYAFGIPATDAPMALGRNRSPTIRWSAGPAGTRSYAIIMHDPDVPSVADDVNQEGKVIPADLPRVDFYHWVLVDVGADRNALLEGADSDGVTVGGKPVGPTEHGVRGRNTYTDFLAGNDEMKGTYGGYDGPCPPWNDELMHRYVFTVYALDVETLGLAGEFTGQQAVEAMKGHVLAQGRIAGTYTLYKPLLDS